MLKAGGQLTCKVIKKIMFKAKWISHPLFIFIFSLCALGTSLYLYIHWYINLNDKFQAFISNYNISPKSIYNTQTWVEILTLSILVAIILAGLAIIFFYYSKLVRLYHHQQNFINGFTHELKTPIASLKLFIETFEKHDLERNDQLKYLQFMKKDIRRLTDNVERILSLSKLETKKTVVAFKSKDARESIRTIISKNDHLFEKCRINIEGEDEKDYRLSINYPLFEILITNLLSNSVQHNNSDNPEIWIKFSSDEGTIIIKVQDNGQGLDRRNLKNVFKKFYKVGKSAKGSGLGLYIASLITKIHKGTIRAESHGLSKGSTFTITFPQKELKEGKI